MLRKYYLRFYKNIWNCLLCFVKDLYKWKLHPFSPLLSDTFFLLLVYITSSTISKIFPHSLPHYAGIFLNVIQEIIDALSWWYKKLKIRACTMGVAGGGRGAGRATSQLVNQSWCIELFHRFASYNFIFKTLLILTWSERPAHAYYAAGVTKEVCYRDAQHIKKMQEISCYACINYNKQSKQEKELITSIKLWF